MATIPQCKKLRRACRELDVVVRVSDLESDTHTEQDAAATWITGHNERITFGEPYRKNGELMVDAIVHVPCKYLKTAPASNGADQAFCAAHGFRGPIPESWQPTEPAAFHNGTSTLSLIHKGRRQLVKIHPKRTKKRSLPVLQPDNPCSTARCRTSDNKVGAACCRDLKLELWLPKKRKKFETLLRTRKPPYLCKIEREDKDTVECEVISACGYLDSDGVGCVLHDKIRPNGKSAKPQLCYDWPELKKDETGHPGCVLV